MHKKLEALKEQLPAALATWQQSKGGRITVGWMHAANPELISEVLQALAEKDKLVEELTAGLHAADERIANLEYELRVAESKQENPETAHAQFEALAENTEPCVLCGKVSSHPEGWHYCRFAGKKEGDA